MAASELYDAIGRGYGDARREDPRLAQVIWAALGAWAERHSDIMDLDALDVGARLVVAETASS